MPFSSRLTNTAATRGRSSARPVSFSTMEARATASSGVLNGSPGRRSGQSPDSTRSRAAIIRRSTEVRSAPRSIS